MGLSGFPSERGATWFPALQEEACEKGVGATKGLRVDLEIREPHVHSGGAEGAGLPCREKEAASALLWGHSLMPLVPQLLLPQSHWEHSTFARPPSSARASRWLMPGSLGHVVGRLLVLAASGWWEDVPQRHPLPIPSTCECVGLQGPGERRLQMELEFLIN